MSVTTPLPRVPADEAARATPADARQRFRTGLAVPTTGWSSGYAQANLVALPREWAFDMLLFAQRNPQAVPAARRHRPRRDLDRRSRRTPTCAPTCPRYRVWRDGVLVDEPPDVVDLWRDDLVTFVIGCSFTFEAALLDAGVPGAPPRAGPQRADVPHRASRAAPPAGWRARSWCRCGRSLPARSSTAVQVTGRMPPVARRAGARRRPGVARHRRPGRPGLRRRPGRPPRATCRCSGPAA